MSVLLVTMPWTETTGRAVEDKEDGEEDGILRRCWWVATQYWITSMDCSTTHLEERNDGYIDWHTLCLSLDVLTCRAWVYRFSHWYMRPNNLTPTPNAFLLIRDVQLVNVSFSLNRRNIFKRKYKNKWLKFLQTFIYCDCDSKFNYLHV